MRRSILILLCSFLSFGLLSQTHAEETTVAKPSPDATMSQETPTAWKDCIKDLEAEPQAIGDFGDHISFGPSVAAQVLRYDLASKKAAFNTGLGAGFSMRYYTKTKIGKEEFGIKQIKSSCRADTLSAAFTGDNKYKVGYLFAVSPFVYVSKVEGTDELNVQPAIQLSFLSDLVTVGTGFNLTGTDKGHMFLLLSLGWGFKM